MKLGNRHQVLDSRVIQDLKNRSYTGIIYYIIALTAVLFPDGYFSRDMQFSTGFLGIIILICLFRIGQRVVDPRIPKRFRRIDFVVFVLSICINSLAWGLGFARLLSQPGEAHTHLLMLISTIGLCSGGVVAFAPILWLSVAFNLFILMPGALYMAVQGTYLTLSFLCLLFSSYMIFLAARINREYWKALRNEFLLKEKSKQLEKISHMDGLTGLYNRRFFDQAFEIEWKRAVRDQTHIAVVLCDIDRFKEVNDSFGHLAGDEYLKLTARTLKKVFRRQTDILVRYGGEEFLILISGPCSDHLGQLSERMREKMEKTVLEYESQAIRTTMSMGLAVMIPKPSDEKTVLISKADSLLYRAKNSGRNQVVSEGA